MRISASIYSDKKRDLSETIQDLAAHHVDLLHVDCNDNPSVFDDIRQIRSWCNIPIDLHIITKNPSKYYDLLREVPVEYVTFQLEDLEEELVIPSDITGKKGLGIITPTSVESFDKYGNFDFILMMATVPGQSGGVFDAVNFKKIRDFQHKYPSKSVHVDGGVNGEVSFILRNMGVHTSVSGSYLFNAPSVGHALMDLTKRNVDSQFVVKDFMIPLSESPVIDENSSVLEVLNAVEDGKLGFALVINKSADLKGLISNADIRKSLIRTKGNLNQESISEIMNGKPLVIQETATVNDLLQQIKKYSFPILYLPVVDSGNKAKGILTFVNLIKGEI
ncbi:CBS domain-containing protein [Fluviicola taffensis]|uniref:CBS domain containing protein n=1 Tax=Fluviicola taffensis (strain DSM 16823 / NCIMB 13979 / RW262) TaxID=755732 RepID=F2IE24_FLUTR|nr:CBS domain-containing protein [Fluviicola taffensis]AEA45588.1 CBS domain containing protein [Fluviicola taffensis DSM 16823]